nr:MAG TPA: hypothetical protein [Caudoviricetes sp.]
MLKCTKDCKVYISIQGNRGVAASTQRALLALYKTAFGGRRAKKNSPIGQKYAL